MIKPRSFVAALLLSVPVAALAVASAPQVSVPPQPVPSMSLTPHKTSMDHKSKRVPKFKRADKNDDGKIEWQEAKAAHVPKKLFKREDFNSNGTLNRSEWAFVRMDMNNAPPGEGSSPGA